jgi:Flp pilus assembly protein TadG
VSASTKRLLSCLVSRCGAAMRLHCFGDRAAEIVELATSLPILVIFVVGIFDFTNAVTLKQKLTNAAREGARVAAADPAADLSDPTTSSGFPASVTDAFYVVDRYLLATRVNDCGLSSQPLLPGSGLTWTATATGLGCTGSGLVLTINRGCISGASAGSTGNDIVCTCVTIQYPYSWQFAGVAGLFGTLKLPTSITTAATAYNEN